MDMKHRTAELEGGLLDAAVAQAEGSLWRWWSGYGTHVVLMVDATTGNAWSGFDLKPYMPSTDWSHGGPIIDREHIALQFYGSHWGAMPHDAAGCEVPDLDQRKHVEMSSGWGPVMADGNTALVAAMRALVRLRLGDEVEL